MSDLATTHTTGVSASSSALTWASVATSTPALRVAPNATRTAFFSSSSVFARAKNSVSFGIAPGQPPSMKPTPSSSSSVATASLSATEYVMPSRWAPSRNVVSKTWKPSPSGDARRAGSGACSGGTPDAVLMAQPAVRSARRERGEPVADRRRPADRSRLPGREVEGHGRLYPARRLGQPQVVQQQRDGEDG